VTGGFRDSLYSRGTVVTMP